MFDKRFTELREAFAIQKPEDWQRVTPAEVTSIENVGPQTLNHLRLHLANHGLTLAGDQTPVHWQTTLSAVRGTSTIAGNQKHVVCPFTILIDKAEQTPWRFQGIRSSTDRHRRPMIVPTKSEHLGPTHGDYTIEGMEGWVHIERKSVEDLIGTVLGFANNGERREQFQRTLAYLAEIPSSAVIVEGDRVETTKMVADPTHPCNRNARVKPAVRAKMFFNQVLAWENDYRVPFIFAHSRYYAERAAFRWLERQWKERQAQLKKAAKQPTDPINI